ncbi:MAG: hypothetical protein WAT93_06175 [Pontixanthobacter sp.]
MTRTRKSLGELFPPDRFNLRKPTKPKPIDPLRKMIRDEINRKSFAAAGGWLTLQELIEFTSIGKTKLGEMRTRRRFAKTQALKNEACFPEYDFDGALRFKQAEVQAWMDSKQI